MAGKPQPVAPRFWAKVHKTTGCFECEASGHHAQERSEMIRRLFFGCFFVGHAHRFWTRTDSGVDVLRCERCGHDQPILASAVIKGPAHEPAAVRGVPKTKTYPEKQVVSFARGSSVKRYRS